MITTLAAVLGFGALASALPPIGQSLNPSSMFSTGCQTNQFSCHNTTVQTNSCCFESPGGLLMQVQFWDTNPSTGPENEWTIHGLWPDYCNGAWGQFCDPPREYPSIQQIVTENKRTDLLDYMKKYWPAQDGDDDTLWKHEWNKHGTCMSTFESKCMPKGSKQGTDALLFVETTINLFKTLPTYSVLAKAGILPSSTKSYTYDQLTAAVKSQIGFIPAFDCNNSTIFEISYYFNLAGSAIDGKWKQIDAYSPGSCPKTGPLWYLPKYSSDQPTTTMSSVSTTQSATSLPSSKATINVVRPGSNAKASGCLAADSTWVTKGCATYTIYNHKSDGTFNLKTNKGPCSILNSGRLWCGSKVHIPTTFTGLTESGNLLAYKGKTMFSTAKVARGGDHEVVWAGMGAQNTISLMLKTQ